MGISIVLPRLSLPLFLLASILSLFLPPISGADLYGLVYKGCAGQTLPGGIGGTAQQALASLSSTLVAQSATSKFYKTTASASGQSPIFGLFQCRGDLTAADCSGCVSRIPSMWTSLCGQAVAARIQLTGCYGLYEISGFPQVSGTKMLYKLCGNSNSGGGFEQKRDTAFSSLESGMASGGGGGFYATSYGSVYAMAQCEGDLGMADCGECITEAVQKSEVECGSSSSGQMYLDKCYISYSYYPNGAPRGGGGGGFSGGSFSGGGGGSGSGQPTGKTVAIVVGGAAGLGFLVICLLFARSLYKKKDDF